MNCPFYDEENKLTGLCYSPIQSNLMLALCAAVSRKYISNISLPLWSIYWMITSSWRYRMSGTGRWESSMCFRSAALSLVSNVYLTSAGSNTPPVIPHCFMNDLFIHSNVICECKMVLFKRFFYDNEHFIESLNRTREQSQESGIHSSIQTEVGKTTTTHWQKMTCEGYKMESTVWL